MTTSDPGDPERPTQEGNLYIYADEDLDRWAGEGYATVREFDGLDDHEAEELVDYAVDLLRGDFMAAEEHTDG